MKKSILDSLNQSQQMLENFINETEMIKSVEVAANILIETLKSGNTIYSCGNGGSMSDAMHFAEELSGKFRKKRLGLSAVAISDPGHITCVANDFGYEYIFSRYLEANSRKNDCLLAISTSGRSLNVLKATEYAIQHGLKVVSLTGAKISELGDKVDVNISVGNSEFADRIQEMHIKIIHILIEQVERNMCSKNYI